MLQVARCEWNRAVLATLPNPSRLGLRLVCLTHGGGQRQSGEVVSERHVSGRLLGRQGRLPIAWPTETCFIFGPGGGKQDQTQLEKGDLSSVIQRRIWSPEGIAARQVVLLRPTSVRRMSFAACPSKSCAFLFIPMHTMYCLV